MRGGQPHPPATPNQTAAGTATGAGPRVALEGKGPQRRPQKRLDRRLEEVAEAVGGGYYWLQMPLKLALTVRETVAGHRLGALEGGKGYPPPPLRMHPWQDRTRAYVAGEAREGGGVTIS